MHIDKIPGNSKLRFTFQP